MPRPALPDRQRRDQKVTALLTAQERAGVERVAAELGMSLSNAARYLINRALAEHPFTPMTGDNSSDRPDD